MTIIAYRDGVLAADQSGFVGSTRHSLHRKIAKRDDGALIGMSGNSFMCAGYIRWFLAGETGERPHLGDKDDSAGGIIVRAGGQVEEFDRFGWAEVFSPFSACGCASDFALAAMEMGADARRAVEVAMKYEGYTGGEIDVLHLDAIEKATVVRIA